MTLATTQRDLEDWLAKAAFNTYYQFRVREIGAGKCTIEVPFRVEFERPGGTVSGPVFMAAADVAIWFAIATRRGGNESWVTVDLKTAFLRGRTPRAVHMHGARSQGRPTAGLRRR